MATDDDEAVIEMDFGEDSRAVVTEQFKKQLPPDYEFDEASFIEFIMLLVANKRSKSQIRREMAPFVGDDAAALVDWLFRTLNAMKPPAAAIKGRLSSVVLAPKSDPAEEPTVSRPTHRRLPSATRLLTNAAKDAAKSTTERKSAFGNESQVSVAERKARFQNENISRPIELRTRRSLDDSHKRSRSPKAAVMDIEAKRLKSHIPQNLKHILDRKLSPPYRSGSLETRRSKPHDGAKLLNQESPSSVQFSRTSLSPESSEVRPAPIRRPHVDSAKLAKLLDRKLSSPGRGSLHDDEDVQMRHVDSKTFTVSIRNDSVEAKLNGALEPEKVSEPKIVFKQAIVKSGFAAKEVLKPADTLDAALPPAKKPIRCTFWPNCDKGEACSFVHPTSPCKYWPSCQYGDKCLYIHDKNLTNVAIPCKFGLQCTRGAECKFSHPQSNGHAKGESKICRYDKRCSKISCPFQHPERERSEYFNETIRENDDDDEDVTVVLSSTLPPTPPSRPY